MSNEILDFWFGQLSDSGLAEELLQKRWFTKDPHFDALIRERFLQTYTQRRAAPPKESVLEIVSSIVLFDQFPRNMFRGTADMFATDDLAMSLSLETLKHPEEQDLPFSYRAFVLMPLMHSENILYQEMCVQGFTSLHDQYKGKTRQAAAKNLNFAVAHQNIIERFGRFPHRNELLERQSTQEELDFLKTKGSSF